MLGFMHAARSLRFRWAGATLLVCLLLGAAYAQSGGGFGGSTRGSSGGYSGGGYSGGGYSRGGYTGGTRAAAALFLFLWGALRSS
ncbi:hypothetical protein ACFP81_04415 [Deinococcus lacus]|uniref:Uncharacterized protein n=1 Tax=Deinococcus lacus TaxID=392561 RepID=A0ABW1YAJ2_9DEIO